MYIDLTTGTNAIKIQRPLIAHDTANWRLLARLSLNNFKIGAASRNSNDQYRKQNVRIIIVKERMVRNEIVAPSIQAGGNVLNDAIRLKTSKNSVWVDFVVKLSGTTS